MVLLTHFEMPLQFDTPIPLFRPSFGCRWAPS